MTDNSTRTPRTEGIVATSAERPARRVLRLAALPGDGVGPEVLPPARAALEAAVAASDVQVEWTEYDLGAHRWRGSTVHASAAGSPGRCLRWLRPT